MKEQNFSALQNITTPEILVEIQKKGSIFAGGDEFLEAEDELLPIANWIKSNTSHNSEINPSRIKFLYTTEVKKDGGRYVLGTLSLRPKTEKKVNDDFDYILLVHYKTWKELDIENKVIQLDKILCGVDVDFDNKTKKQSVDCKEYMHNLKHYGEIKVLNSSEIVDMATERILDEEKVERKSKKENK